MDEVGAPSVHVGKRFLPGSTVEVEDEEHFRTAIEASGSREIRVVFFGRYEKGGTWFELEEFWSGPPRWKDTPDGKKLDVPTPEPGARYRIGRKHDVRFVKWAVRAGV